MRNVVFLKWDFNFSELSKQSPFEKSYFSPDFLFPLKFPSSSLWIPVKEHCQVEFFNIFTFCLQLNFAINNKPSNSISIDVLSTLKCFILFKMVERQKFKLLTFQKVFPSDPSKGVCWILWKANLNPIMPTYNTLLLSSSSGKKNFTVKVRHSVRRRSYTWLPQVP